MRTRKGPRARGERLVKIAEYIRGHWNCKAADIVNDTGYRWDEVERAIYALTYQLPLWESDDRPARYGIDDSLTGECADLLGLSKADREIYNVDFLEA